MIDYLLNLVLEKYLRKNKKERKVGVYYPSELSFPCLRRNYYLYKQPRELPLDKLLLFESGNEAHRWLYNVLNTDIEGVHIESIPEGELVFTTGGISIVGRYDDLLLIKFTKDSVIYLVLIEIKSVKNLDLITKVSEHHNMQIMFYMRLLGLDEGYIVYIDRRNYKYKVYHIKYSEEIFKKLVNRAKKLHKHLIENKIPEPEGKETWACRYCEYGDICGNNG